MKGLGFPCFQNCLAGIPGVALGFRGTVTKNNETSPLISSRAQIVQSFDHIPTHANEQGKKFWQEYPCVICYDVEKKHVTTLNSEGRFRYTEDVNLIFLSLRQSTFANFTDKFLFIPIYLCQGVGEVQRAKNYPVSAEYTMLNPTFIPIEVAMRDNSILENGVNGMYRVEQKIRFCATIEPSYTAQYFHEDTRMPFESLDIKMNITNDTVETEGVKIKIYDNSN